MMSAHPAPECDVRRILTLNTGSSSLKIALFHVGEDVIKTMSGEVTGIGASEARMMAETAYGDTLWDTRARCINHPAALDAFFQEMAEHVDLGGIAAVGHRVVHGGPHYTKAARLTPKVEADLRKLIPLAPLHMPANLDGIVAARLRLPEAIQYACFDTSFHAGMPLMAQRTGLAPGMEGDLIRRYGFHGLSYEYIVDDLGTRAGTAAARQRLLVAHLGAGASMTAIHNGETVDTSMGFSALAGLPMATRSGDVDPGLLLYMILELNWDPSVLQDQLYHGAGLLGLSGISGDVKSLLKSDDPRAGKALAQFAYQARKQAGALIAAMGGVDRIIFTGGVGEHAPSIRAAICEPLGDLYGIDFDARANAQGDACITHPGSPVIVETVHTDEAMIIARGARAILESCPKTLDRQAS
ncbi:MAG TPA: acetate/propionate family kinase [Hyphomonas sp.]|jgi:acetate kinase|uniref:acetate/propionate family kinase n=1 Tax=uncultured Hyphomonas sp. TaxID=225298 RepID=UPI000C64BB66|nr:acetate kinase [Hyphomonas sp.]MAN91631.1 acetate kinase [Hyphomonadaceae bacterium]HBL93785.1 acetate/propionate family kinase [Hyphomonas sp.]HCJ18795.1 acetate/propionate family kinase [Hyphomonas sp.]|tara:strand:- start:47246 stop:48484 length:1239 start_codon:yes stop_codon:yes gene_type:complete